VADAGPSCGIGDLVSSEGAVMTINPKTGHTDRSFAHLWQAVRYETGYSAGELFLQTQPYADEFFRLGKRDAREDLAKQAKKLAPTLREHYKPSNEVEWQGVLIVAGCVAIAIVCWLIVMTSDYKLLP